MVSYFSQSKGQGSVKSFFVTHHPFQKVFCITKKTNIALVGTFGLFL
jgi:hypothetical protein